MDKTIIIPISNIYLLRDPNTNEIKYIGRTKNPESRFKGHLNFSGERDKDKWVLSLINSGKRPIMEIIETCPFYMSREREAFYLVKYINEGHKLFNLVSTHWMKTSQVHFEFELTHQSKIDEICYRKGLKREDVIKLSIEHFYNHNKTIEDWGDN